MFLDARGVADGSELDCDVCIVGAGAAGITIARELAASSASVILLESGGFRGDEQTQLLYDGDVVGHSYAPLAQTRIRAFGGSTGHWEGWCRPLDAADLAERSWVPWSGWPLNRRELDPYYARAHTLCQLGPYDYRPEFWARTTGERLLALDRSVDHVVYQFSPPTRFGVAYRDDIRDARNVRALLYANAVQVRRRPESRLVDRVDVATLSGRRFSVKPKRVVLATGGIENARLLLAWDLGNDRGLVGRFFAEHIHASAALVTLPRRLGGGSEYVLRRTRLGQVRNGLATSQAVEEERKILRLAATLDRLVDDPFVPRGDEEDRAIRFGDSVADVARATDGGEEHELFALFVRAEQAPNPASRVVLGDEVDALGIPKARLDWKLGELDHRSIRQTLEVFAEAFGRARLGRLYSRPAAEREFWQNVFGGSHHIGTTRMHRSPRFGVVDANSRVHGVANLYVAGSSVFPTAGYANPTLTIVALSLRLADHLRGLLS